MYFDVDKRYDWRLTTSKTAFAAYRAMGLDPYFNTANAHVAIAAGPPLRGGSLTLTARRHGLKKPRLGRTGQGPVFAPFSRVSRS